MSLIVGSGVIEWVAKQTHEYGNFGAAQGIGWRRNGEIVAGVVFNEFNGVTCCLHVASIGSHWLSREFLWTCFDYPFCQLKVQRLTVLIGEGNAKARRFNEHLGFTLETTLERAHPTGKLMVYRMFKEDCKWIKLGLEKRFAKAA